MNIIRRSSVAGLISKQMCRKEQKSYSLYKHSCGFESSYLVKTGSGSIFRKNFNQILSSFFKKWDPFSTFRCKITLKFYFSFKIYLQKYNKVLHWILDWKKKVNVWLLLGRIWNQIRVFLTVGSGFGFSQRSDPDPAELQPQSWCKPGVRLM